MSKVPGPPLAATQYCWPASNTGFSEDAMVVSGIPEKPLGKSSKCQDSIILPGSPPASLIRKTSTWFGPFGTKPGCVAERRLNGTETECDRRREFCRAGHLTGFSRHKR